MFESLSKAAGFVQAVNAFVSGFGRPNNAAADQPAPSAPVVPEVITVDSQRQPSALLAPPSPSSINQGRLYPRLPPIEEERGEEVPLTEWAGARPRTCLARSPSSASLPATFRPPTPADLGHRLSPHAGEVSTCKSFLLSVLTYPTI